MSVEAVLKRAALVGAFAMVGVGLAPAAASADAVPYSVNITEFSKQVSGVAPPGVNAETVDLLRNTLDPSGKVVRNQVDSFMASVTAGSSWSGAFVSHEPSGLGDQVEVNYTPTPNETDPMIESPQQLTIGSGHFLPSADQRDANGVISAESVQIDPGVAGTVSISPDGSTITCNDCSDGFQASVAGGPPQQSSGDALMFSTPVTASQPVQVTAEDLSAENTQVNLSFPAPQLSLAEKPLATAPSGTTAGAYQIRGLPWCDAYLAIDEVACHNLTPGSYTLTDGSQSRQITVPPAVVMPAQDNDVLQSLFVPQEAGAAMPNLAGGQTVTLSQGSRVLSSLTVDSLKLGSSLPLGDLLNGANATTTGSCSPGRFIQDGTTDPLNPEAYNPDLCTLAGGLPTVNNLTDLATSLTENDETSPGSTTVMLPQFALQQPAAGAAVFTPFTVTAQLRYTDPLKRIMQDNTQTPFLGAPAVVASTRSSDTAAFAYAPLGSSKFRTLGNANRPGGVQLPASLPIGAYDGRWTVSDQVGDSYQRDIVFYNQGARSGNLAAPKCTVKVKGAGLRHASIARARAATSAATTATFHCIATARAGVALWLQRGSTVIADGSGIAKHGKVTIRMAATNIRKGTYQLIEMITLNGQTSQTSHILKLR